MRSGIELSKNVLAARRRALGLRSVLAAAVVALTPGLGYAATLTIASAGGAYDACVKQAFVVDFEKETGIKGKFGSVYYDMGVWKTQQESKSYEWDVAPADLNQVDQLVAQGWLTPIDPSVLKGHDLIDYPNMVVKKGNDIYSVPSEIFGNVIVYNTDKFGANPPKNWADVFDLKKYPGKRLFSKSVSDYGVLEMALLADGVEASALYPLDVDRALRKLDTIKSEILWYESGAQQVTLLQQGDAVIGAGWDGRIKALQKQGGKVGFTPYDGILRPDEWILPKGGNTEIGTKFLAFMLRPEQQAKVAACIGYAPPYKDAYPLLPKGETFTAMPGSMSHRVVWNQDYWNANAKTVTEKFNGWLTR